MLVDEQNSNVLPLLSKVVKGLLYGRVLGLGVDN